MSLKDQLDLDLKTAMRARDENRVTTIRMLKAAISNFELARGDPKSKELGQPVTELDLQGVVEKQIKQRRESIEAFDKGNRPELSAKEAAEIQVLLAYLPQQMTEAEIRAEVQAIIAELDTKDFPKVMRAAAPRFKGRADGKLLSQIVKELTA